jgi:threonine dehydrogenase-like Zn-dependent dehydrogenase
VAAADLSAAEAVRELTSGRGADACIELSGSYPAVQEAIRTCCYGGRVVAAGFYQGEAGALRLGEEFHHNRVEFVSSQISGPPARYSHRWSRERLHEGFMDLVIGGRVDPRPLVSHVVPASRVAEAYATIAAGADDLRQVVLDFRREKL